MIPAPFDDMVLWTLPVLGAMVGSFLNVCIYRLPREALSVVQPPSHCPSCGHAILAWENVPILSYLALGGRCRSCRGKIHWTYPAVELVTLGLFWGLAWLFLSGELRFAGLAADGAAGLWERLGVLAVSCGLAAALVVATLVDLRYRIIPDEVTVFAVAPAILAGALFPSLHAPLPTDVFKDRHLAGLAASVFGAFAGGGSLLVVGWIGKKIFRKEAMGFGDVKLMAFLGAVLGWKGALLTFFVACLVGAVIGVFVLFVRRDHYTPFGPYLALGAGISFLVGDRVLDAFAAIFFPPGLVG